MKVCFGTLLKQCRARRQLTLRELGKLSGIDHAYLHRLESGAKSRPSAKTMRALVAALKPDAQTKEMLTFLAGRDIPESVMAFIREL